MWEQSKACEEGAEIIVATPVSLSLHNIKYNIKFKSTYYTIYNIKVVCGSICEACEEGAEIIVATPVSLSLCDI